MFICHAWSLRSWRQEKAQRQEEGHEEGQQKDAVQLWQVKTSQNKALYSRVKAEAKRKFDGVSERVCKCVAGTRI